MWGIAQSFEVLLYWGEELWFGISAHSCEVGLRSSQLRRESSDTFRMQILVRLHGDVQHGQIPG